MQRYQMHIHLIGKDNFFMTSVRFRKATALATDSRLTR